MIKLESKTGKYLLLLVALYLIKNLFAGLIAFFFDTFLMELPSTWHYYFFKINHHLLNFIFSIVIYYDYKREHKKDLLIPLLAFLNPIVGTLFYFISIFLINPKRIAS